MVWFHSVSRKIPLVMSAAPASTRHPSATAISGASPVTTYSGQTSGCVASAFSMRRAAQQPSAASQTKISRRRSKRSASTPPYRPNTTSGTSSTAPSRPTATVDPVSCLAWTSRATSVAWVPSAMTVRLAYSSRKSRAVRSGVRSARSLDRGNPGLSPDFLGDVDDQFELGDFLLVAQHVALDGGGEAALRRQAELVERHELGRLLDPALEHVRVLQFAALGGDQAEHDHLAPRHEAQRLETAGALVVPLTEEPVHVQLAEQGLGDEVVPARGGPGGPEVAPAHVRGDRHAGGLGHERVVDLADVAQVQVVGVLAPGGDLGPLYRVVEVGQAGVVELEIGTPQGGQPGDLVGIGGGQVAPELLDVRIDVRVDRGRAATVVDHVRRGDGQLRGGAARQRLQIGEVLFEDRLGHMDLAAHVQRRRGELDVPGRVVELHRQVARRLADPADLVDEVHVPGGP